MMGGCLTPIPRHFKNFYDFPDYKNKNLDYRKMFLTKKKNTFIHRLFYIDTIDEVIDERIQQKRNLSDLTVDFVTTNEDYLAGLQVSPMRSNDR